MNILLRRLQFWIVVTALWATTAVGADTKELLETIRSVGREGKGNAQAAKAIREVVQADASLLPVILESLDGANPIAANWIRGAVESITDRALKQHKRLPVKRLEQFARDTSHDPHARRLAFELVARVDKTVADRLIPGMLYDPSREFRRDAVARLIDQAKTLQKQGKTDQAAGVYQDALSGAVDDDQVKALVKPLRGLGHKVDLQSHFGFLTSWHMIGPFNNREDVGYDTAYPPERRIDLAATYAGQLGEVRWTLQSTDNDYGVLDIEKLFKNYKGSIMYATTEFTSPTERTVEFRLGMANAWKLWLNGELLFSRHEYHRGMMLDQYKVPVSLKPGSNRILLKICQNEQKETWAQRYRFQLRVCDATGCAIPPASP